MRNVLVISSSEWPVAALRAALGDDIDELGRRPPDQSREWLTQTQTTTRESGPTTQHPRLQTRCPPKRTEASAGDSDPLLAAEDALGENDFVVATEDRRAPILRKSVCVLRTGPGVSLNWSPSGAYLPQGAP